MKNVMLRVVGFAIVGTMSVLAYGQAKEIIVDGQNAPGWNQKLGVTAMRASCNASPEDCMKAVAGQLASQHLSRFYLNTWDDPKTIVERTAYYSNASLSQRGLVELDIDDFPDHFNNWCRAAVPRCDVLLGQVIAAAKSKNGSLKFGVAVYEDQLEALVNNPRFTPSLRSQIDTVHLALHQRQNGPQFETYVNIVKHKFPNAQVIAASYNQDRIDYAKCGNVRCTAAQERDLYKQTLELQLNLLQHGVVNGIEFYPAYFGWEEKWKSWSNPRICAPNRVQECIDNSKAMNQATLQLFQKFSLGSH